MNRWGVREHFVYWLFDADGNCLYVGMTRKPEQRWRQHRYGNPKMAARVAKKRMAGPFHLSEARRLERQQQDELQPIYDANQASMRLRAMRHPTGATRWSGQGVPLGGLA